MKNGAANSEEPRFDAVIGNPPYQESANSGTPIWQHFTLLGLRLIDGGGTLALVHPPAWRACGPTNAKSVTEAREAMKAVDLEWISMTSKRDCTKTFPGISIPFDAYVARLPGTPGFETEIEGVDSRTFRFRAAGAPFIPNCECPDLDLLIAGEGEERVEWLQSNVAYGETKEWMSRERTDEFRHPCVYSVSRNRELADERGGKPILRWSSRISEDADGKPIHFGTPKVIFGTWHESGIPLVDADGEYGLCADAAGIAADPDDLPMIAEAMDSDRFRAAMAAVRFTTRDWNRNVLPMLKRDFWKTILG